MSARRISSTSSTATRPRSCSATSCRAARAARNGRSASRSCSSISSPATRPITARRGAIPTRTVFGWQRPCYLLGEGYAKTFRELMDETDWDRYGVGNYEKCADCMVHSRLRGHGRGRHDAPSDQGGVRRRCAACAPTARWRRTSRSTVSGRRSSCSHATSTPSWPRSRPQSPGPSRRCPRSNDSKACSASRPVWIKAGS